MRQELTRAFHRLAEALGVERLPSWFNGDEPLTVSLNADQEGFNHADTQVLVANWTVPKDAAPPSTYDLITGADQATSPTNASLAEQFRVLTLSMQNVEVVDPGDVVLQYANAGSIVVHSIVSTRLDFAALDGTSFPLGGISVSEDFLPTGPLWVPAGFRPQLRLFYTPTGDAGSLVQVRASILRMRAGFAGAAR